MSFSVTALGGVFLPLLLFVFLFRRAWLIQMVCVAAVLQGPAVATVSLGESVYGLTPFVFAAGLATLDLLIRWRRDGFELPADLWRRRLIGVWVLCGAVAILSAFVLPWLFAGAPVYVPLEKLGADGDVQPLAWSINHAAQAFNRGLLVGVMLWLVQQRNDPALPRRFVLSITLALVVAAAIGLQQRLGWNGLVPMWEGFWTSNPTYAQNFNLWAGSVPRVSWPFVEPSYASAWFAAVLGGFVALFVTGIRRHRALLGVLVAGFALANTLGATGMLTALAYLALLALFLEFVLMRRREMRGIVNYQIALGSLVVACICLAAFLVLREYGLLPAVADAVPNVLKGRSQTLLGDLRPHADVHALRVFVDTWGLGAGLGSNRGSSYVTTLASNVGIAGLLTFLAAVWLQYRLLLRQVLLRFQSADVFFLGSGVAALLAVMIAIPDQNWPVLWMMLFGGLVCVLREHPISATPGESTEHARR